ncbi:MAG: phosphate ABC transporter substrate-binding protein [candidate division KSB1 bacterium]|nr:phosphate ABC transporter substrate-binding protein [candidate division KSB1 bacterium]MDZ7346689.1 phosphate ABC transporter substrate-binding protein [candidate division KSB1 bacterium]
MLKAAGLVLLAVSSSLFVSCLYGRSSQSAAGVAKRTIQNTGSDTMVNLAQAWAEAYAHVNDEVSIEVSGGGSGTGIAALIENTVDIANCSRRMEPMEIKKAKEHTGKDPVEFLVGYDALAIYVHRDNPIDSLSIEELAEIYGEHGKITRWSQLGVTLPKGARDEIMVVSRQSNSGTYHYFREAVIGKKRDMRLGTIDMHGSKDVVELVSRTPSAIGYSGMGYANDRVKMLRICRKKGEPAYAPTIENTQNGKYPIARPLLMYTLGEPNETIRKYLDWILSPEGQHIVKLSGYVPVHPEEELQVAGGKQQ